jgi:hypothetical protein
MLGYPPPQLLPLPAFGSGWNGLPGHSYVPPPLTGTLTGLSPSLRGSPARTMYGTAYGSRYPPVGAFATQRLVQPGVQPLVRTVKGSANVTMEKLIELYKMQEHPEGGWFVETYRSELPVAAPAGERAASTAIYFLITPGSVSRLHRLQSDEVWHFYLGGPLTVVELVDDGAKTTVVGPDVANGEVVQHVVKAGTWFGSFPCEGSKFSFVGCTVAPGFDFADFELGSRSALVDEFPKAVDMITKLTEGLP